MLLQELRRYLGRIRIPAAIHIEKTKAIIRGPMIRVYLERMMKFFLGLLVHPLRKIRTAEIIANLSIFWLKLERTFKHHDRFSDHPLPDVPDAKIKVRRCATRRVFLDETLHLRHRFIDLPPAEILIRQSQTGVIIIRMTLHNRL